MTPNEIIEAAIAKIQSARQRLLDDGLTVPAVVENSEIALEWMCRPKGWQIVASWRGGPWKTVLELPDEGKLAACALLPELAQAVREAFDRRARAAGLID